MGEPHLHKLFIGKVKKVGKKDAEHPMDREWETGMFKKEQADQVWLTETGFQGDEVSDKRNHGGPEKAVFAYPAKHYEYWQEKLERDDIGPGGMGENFSVFEMDEETVCIGDSYRVGDAVIQVSQPRNPCWRPARRYKVIDLALQIQNSGKTGWYYRVLQEGDVKGDMPIVLLDRPYPEWTIKAANEVMHVDKKNLEKAKALASCELLAENWRERLKKRLGGNESGIERRVYGPNK